MAVSAEIVRLRDGTFQFRCSCGVVVSAPDRVGVSDALVAHWAEHRNHK